jgi:hypothetical protein
MDWLIEYGWGSSAYHPAYAEKGLGWMYDLFFGRDTVDATAGRVSGQGGVPACVYVRSWLMRLSGSGG